MVSIVTNVSVCNIMITLGTTLSVSWLTKWWIPQYISDMPLAFRQRSLLEPAIQTHKCRRNKLFYLQVGRQFICNHPSALQLGKDKKDKGEKKAAFNTTTGKDKKEGKQKLQSTKEEVSLEIYATLSTTKHCTR